MESRFDGDHFLFIMAGKKARHYFILCFAVCSQNKRYELNNFTLRDISCICCVREDGIKICPMEISCCFCISCWMNEADQIIICCCLEHRAAQMSCGCGVFGIDEYIEFAILLQFVADDDDSGQR